MTISHEPTDGVRMLPRVGHSPYGADGPDGAGRASLAQWLAKPGHLAQPNAAPKAKTASRANFGFMFRHAGHALALGFGAGLSPIAPGTVATLWAWAAFLVGGFFFNDFDWAVILFLGFFVAWWASTVTAGHLNQADPSAIVIDEIWAFWFVLWLVMPAGFGAQLAAFVIFRALDGLKPPPISWADSRFKGSGARGGFGIVFDDALAAGITVLLVALWRSVAH